ncbi:MAG: thiamine-phosphate kinase [Gemmatimonadota bacterium]
MSELGAGREFDLIRTFLSNVRMPISPELRVGPGDDCAVLTTSPFAISSDMSVENVHFRRDWLAPREIGYRATVAALSDLAAMAALPMAALLSFAFKPEDANGWAVAVMQGATDALADYDTVLAGGDVARADHAAVIDVVVIGKVENPLLRSSARIGDEVWVTGRLGGAAAAVASWLQGGEPDALARERYARPTARIREAIALRKSVNAMIDISDGIAGDVRHIAAASGCKLVIDAAWLPVHPSATIDQALQGGEDYELCFTASPGAVFNVAVELTRIGYCSAGEGVEIRNGPDARGYDHFGAESQ